MNCFVVEVKLLNKIFREEFLDNLVFRFFRLVSILKSTNKIFEKHVKNQFLRQVVPNLSPKFLKNTCREIGILESCSVSMKKTLEIHLWMNSFFQFTVLLVMIVIVKMFDISFIKPPSRNSMLFHLVYNEDKIIYFLYIFILIYRYIV